MPRKGTDREVWEANELRKVFNAAEVSRLTGFSSTWVKANTANPDGRHNSRGHENAFYCGNPKPLPDSLMVMRSIA